MYFSEAMYLSSGTIFPLYLFTDVNIYFNSLPSVSFLGATLRYPTRGGAVSPVQSEERFIFFLFFFGGVGGGVNRINNKRFSNLRVIFTPWPHADHLCVVARPTVASTRVIATAVTILNSLD